MSHNIDGNDFSNYLWDNDNRNILGFNPDTDKKSFNMIGYFYYSNEDFGGEAMPLYPEEVGGEDTWEGINQIVMGSNLLRSRADAIVFPQCNSEGGNITNYEATLSDAGYWNLKYSLWMHLIKQ